MYALRGRFGGTLAGEVRHLTRLKFVPGRTVVHLARALVQEKILKDLAKQLTLAAIKLNGAMSVIFNVTGR